ncbi:MAG: BACON domain-containing protein [Bacteroidales bacterium]|nr:BACON domain-containing protein [Bacteroidales bacterium]
MKTILKLMTMFALIALTALSCKKTPTYQEPALSVSREGVAPSNEIVFENLSNEGATVSFNVISNREWSISMTSSSEGWYHPIPVATAGRIDGANNQTITVNVDQNSGAGRTVTFTVKAAYLTATVRISQLSASGTIEGDGSKDNPYTVAQAISFTDATPQVNDKWVSGYIVGGILIDESITNLVTNPEGYVFDSIGIRSTAVMIADDPEEKDPAKVLLVRLNNAEGAVASTARPALNMVDNCNNYKTVIKVEGDIFRYFGVPGIQRLTDFEGGNKGCGDGPGPIVDPDPVASLIEDFESFTSGPGTAYMNTQSNSKGWRGVSVQGTLEANVRVENSNNYVQFSAHRNTGVTDGATQEFWLISPRLDLDAATDKTLSFDLAAIWYNANTTFEVYILDSENPATANKVKLTFQEPVNPPTSGTPLVYTPSGNVDLSGHTGVKRIGFYYKGTSGSGNSTTYQLDNFNFGGGAVATLTVNPASLSFEPEGGAKSFMVSSNQSWTATSSDETNFAVTIDGNEVTVTATENEGSSRTAEITVKTTDNSITRIVSVSQASPNVLAAWDFASATDLTAASGAVISKTASGGISYTESSRTIYCSGWDGTAGKHWLLTIPVSKDVSGTIVVDFIGFGTNTGPRNWKIQSSSDNTNWTDGDSYTLANVAYSHADAQKSVSVTLPATIPAGGTLYIRLATTDLVSIAGNTVASGGNSRLATVVVSY